MTIESSTIDDTDGIKVNLDGELSPRPVIAGNVVRDTGGVRIGEAVGGIGVDFSRTADTEPPAPSLPTIGGFVQLPQAWHSSAGIIQNLVEHMVGGVGIIHSAKGEMRANHHHLTDYHYLYIVSGSFQYTEWPVNGDRSDEDSFELTARAGQMIFTPPMRNHGLYFLEHTVMVSISKLSRQHASHEADVIRL